MACKIGQIAIGHIGQIKGCFTKVPPCVRARLKLCGNGVTSVQSVLFCFRVLSLHIGQIFCNMHHITDVTRYPQTCSESDARLALPHAGDVALQVLTSIGERVQGHPGRAAADCCARPAWLDASCRRSWSWIGSGLHVDSARPCCSLVAWCRLMGASMGGYLHG